MPERTSRLRVPMPALGFGGAQLGNLYRPTSDTDAGQAVYRDNVRAWVATRGIIDSLLDLGGRPGAHDSRPGRQRP